jgi:hypothetical protein
MSDQVIVDALNYIVTNGTSGFNGGPLGFELGTGGDVSHIIPFCHLLRHHFSLTWTLLTIPCFSKECRLRLIVEYSLDLNSTGFLKTISARSFDVISGFNSRNCIISF